MKHLTLILWFAFLCFQGLAQSADSFYKKAEVKSNTGQYAAAILLYTRAIKVDPKFIKAYYKRGFAHSILKDYGSAVKDYSMVISKNPKHTWSYISRGSSYNKLKKFDLAMVDFDKAIEIDPTNQEAYNNRGWAKLGLDDKKGACKDWKKSKKMGNGEAKIILDNNHCK
ncbi:MAG: hypothetical protein COB85_09200 [Bacteroidetes bacterium]|nr:MAG: hypothetical protein COB85_09200 [Bacteroidota bacterium]